MRAACAFEFDRWAYERACVRSCGETAASATRRVCGGCGLWHAYAAAGVLIYLLPGCATATFGVVVCGGYGMAVTWGQAQTKKRRSADFIVASRAIQVHSNVILEETSVLEAVEGGGGGSVLTSDHADVDRDHGQCLDSMRSESPTLDHAATRAHVQALGRDACCARRPTEQ
jgi:hypothetical protein